MKLFEFRALRIRSTQTIIKQEKRGRGVVTELLKFLFVEVLQKGELRKVSEFIGNSTREATTS